MALRPPQVPPTPGPEADAVGWWDLKDVAAAADKLRDALPPMLSYWDRCGASEARREWQQWATVTTP